MAVNLSVYSGIPITLESAEEQFNSHMNYPKSKGIFQSDGGFLVLKKIEQGKYKGCFGVFYYCSMPKTGFIRAEAVRRLPGFVVEAL